MTLRTILLAGAAATTMISSGAVVAQAAPVTAAVVASPAIGDVVITARKRAENLQRVPEAITAQTGKQLLQQGVFQPTDLGRVVPSLQVAGSQSLPDGAIISIRGSAPGDVLVTVPQTVGFYEDSVVIPHPVGTNSALFDDQRVEVIEGPQGTLYGRNTTGGAINVITNGADYNGYHGFVYGEAGNYDDAKLAGAVNIPIISDVLSVRLADQYWYRQGFGVSSVTGEHMGDDHNDNTFRMSVRFDPAPNFTSTTKFEFDNLDQHGAMITLSAVAPEVPNAFGPLGLGIPGQPLLNASEALYAAGGTDTGINPLTGAITPGSPAAIGAARLEAAVSHNFFVNSSQGVNQSRVQVYHAVEDFTWTINDDVKLRSITGYHYVTDFFSSDLDASPFQILEIDAGKGGTGAQPVTGPYTFPTKPDQQYGSFTQEFDFSGKAFNRLDWLVGGYGSYEDADSGQPSINSPLYYASPFYAGLIGAIIPPSTILTNSEVFADPGMGAVSGVLDRNVKTITYGIYSQDDFHITDTLSLTLGGRFSQEEEAQDDADFAFDPTNNTFWCSAVTAAPGNNPLRCAIHQKNSAGGFSYLASLNWQATPDILLYVKTARGFKGGALEERDPAAKPVKPEVAVDYEGGLKADFFDHRLRANLAGYVTNYYDKQETGIGISPFAGLTTVISTAGTAQIYGFEATLTAAPVDGLTLYSVMDYIQGVYTKYGTPFCNTPASTITDGCPVGPEGTTIDASGTKIVLPPWQVTVGGRYQFDLGPGQLAVEADYAWHAASPNTVLSFSPSLEAYAPGLQKSWNESFGLLNGRIDYVIPEQGLTLSVYSTNLLNRHYQIGGVPVIAEFGFATSTTEDPMMFAFSVRKTFGHGE
jgi:iron complex outermembrane recepter protein